jgi:hypothetical protein
MDIHSESLAWRRIRIKAEYLAATKKRARSVQSDDRDDPPEKLPSGRDQQSADNQETAVPRHSSGFPSASLLGGVHLGRSYFVRFPGQGSRIG